MLLIIALVLSRWHTAFFFRTADLALRVLALFLADDKVPGRVVPARLTVDHAEYGHDVPLNAVFKVWYLAPRVTVAIWVAGGIVAVADHFKLLPGSRALSIVEVAGSRREVAAVPRSS